jgi:Flp pilus assembly protein TadG
MIERLRTNPLKRLLHCERGASLVEFAILLPPLTLLLIGTIELGRFMFFGILAANAANAGAQFGAQNTTTAANYTAMQTAAVDDGQSLPGFSATASCFTILNGTTAACPTPPASATPAPGSIYYVEVQTTGTYSSLMKYPGIPRSVTVKGKAVMRVVSQ